MSAYFELIKPTFIENWPQGLTCRSIAQADVPLTVAEARALGSNSIDYGEAFGPMADISGIRAKVESAVARFPRGAFVRLGSRSPKDSWQAHREGSMLVRANRQGESSDPLRFLLDASERIYEDLTLAIQENYAPHIFVREWLEIPKWSEFRCFMRDRKLVGVSQYFYRDGVFPKITGEAEFIFWIINNFFAEFGFLCHLNDVVFDVIVKRKPHSEHQIVWEIKLLEINPFCEMTDPCLYSWNNGGDFDSKMRYNK